MTDVTLLLQRQSVTKSCKRMKIEWRGQGAAGAPPGAYLPTPDLHTVGFLLIRILLRNDIITKLRYESFTKRFLRISEITNIFGL